MIKRPFSSKGNRAIVCLELVHTNVSGPINFHARGGYEYFITCTYNFSGYGYVYMMHRNSKFFDMFKEFKVEAERQALRSYRGGKYLSTKFKDFF